MQRYGMVIGIKPEMIAAYKRLHAAVWPAVLAQISHSHISNYSIYLREPENLLFSHFEYHGHDFAADMAAMAADPETRVGGLSACPARSHYSAGRLGSIGPRWKRCFTAINELDRGRRHGPALTTC